MPKENFNSETKSFKDLFIADSIYKIPSYQRDYSWCKKDGQLDDLWNDILPNDRHYVGFLVFKPVANSKTLEVIDGQQRLATISIIILAALDILKEYINNPALPQEQKKEESERFEDLSKAYIGKKDLTSRTFYNTLMLNKVNGGFFQEICNDKIKLSTEPTITFTNEKHKSNKKIKEAFFFFREKVKKYLDNNLNGEKISKLIDDIASNLFFTVLYVSNDENAYTLFETLNARGMKLASVDLLKNFMYSTVSGDPQYLTEMETLWENISDNISKDGEMNRFIRTDWGSRYPIVEDRRLFRTITGELNACPDKAFRYIHELKSSSKLFCLIQNPLDPYWAQSGFNTIVQQELETLDRLQITQVYGILFAYLKRIGPSNFHNLLSYLTKISFRFNTISGFDAKEQESVYNSIAIGITNGTISDFEAIKKYLKKIYVNKATFISNFSNAEIKKASQIKYIFNQINIKKGGADINVNGYTIEHILPQKGNSGWDTFPDDEKEDSIWKLGNMTLLTKEENELLDDKPYSAKVAFYAKNNMPIVNEIADYPVWNKESIKKRQAKLAKLAEEIWNIQEFEDR